MPDDYPKKPPRAPFTVPDEDPPHVAALRFSAGTSGLIGLILLLLGLLGDCLEQLLTALGGALIVVAVITWLWTRAANARLRKQRGRLQAQIDEYVAGGS